MSNIFKDVIMNEDIEPEVINSDSDDNAELCRKVDMINQDPALSIIPPYINFQDELIALYRKYSMLPKKFKRLSNQYSMQLFGYNVPNMYEKVKAKITSDNSNDVDPTEEEFPSESSSIMETINLAAINNDESLLEEVDTSNLKPLEKAKIDYEIKDAKKDIQESKYYNFEDFNAVPWFTLDEEYCKLEFFEDKEYIKKLIEAEIQYKYNPCVENCTKLLELGWNPSVRITKESMEYAKKRQAEYLREHQAFIYDLTKTTDISSIQESSRAMKEMYKELDVYPVYIVLSWTNTNFGKIIKFVKNSKYTHAGMSLDSNLDEIVTFKYDSVSTGFEIENLKGYINTYRDCQIEVLCLFVDKNVLKKLKSSIEYYKKAKDVTKYGFKNLFNILLNRKKEFTAFDTEMVCSQFVDHILKLCDIDITGKSNNLVIPQDYATIASKNPKVYKIFEGYGKDYYDGKAEGVIKELLEKNGSGIRYKEESFNLDTEITIPVELAVRTV